MDNKTNKILPELRFPGFDESWISAKMGDMVSFKTTNSFSRENLNYNNGLVKNIHYGDIHTKFQTLFDITNETVPFINEDINIQKIKDDNYCQVGDLIFADASEDLDDIGKSIEIINLNGEKLVSGLHTLLARPNPNQFHRGFFGYLLKSDFIRKQIQKESQGTKVLSISATRLSNLIIHFPLSIIHCHKEQQKIASCLSSLDEVITAHSQKLELLKDLKKGLMQNLFPQKGEKVPKFRFKEFEGDGEWVEKTLDKVVIDFIVPMRDKPKKLDGEIPWCRIEDFNGIYLSSSKSNQGVSLETVKEMNLKIYPVNTLLVSCSADMGRCAITKKPLITNQTFIGLVPNVKKIDSLFLYYIMTNSRNELNAKSSGTTISYLSRQQFEKFEILIPPNGLLKEQQKIASCLSSLDALIGAQAVKIEQLKLHKKGLMQGLFPKIITN